jgi:hypothetical protein
MLSLNNMRRTRGPTLQGCATECVARSTRPTGALARGANALTDELSPLGRAGILASERPLPHSYPHTAQYEIRM